MIRPVNFNIERANAAGDCRLVSVTDCLEDALEQSRDGRWTKALCVFYEPVGKDGDFKVLARCAGLTTLEVRGLMMSFMKEDFAEG